MPNADSAVKIADETVVAISNLSREGKDVFYWPFITREEAGVMNAGDKLLRLVGLVQSDTPTRNNYDRHCRNCKRWSHEDGGWCNLHDCFALVNESCESFAALTAPPEESDHESQS